MKRETKDSISSVLAVLIVAAVGVIFFRNNMPDKSDQSAQLQPVLTQAETPAPEHNPAITNPIV